MSSLLTEILISLVVIAVIGGIIGWLIRGVYIGHREQKLEHGIEKSAQALEESEKQVKRLEANLRKFNVLRKTEMEKFDLKAQEVHTAYKMVEQRDKKINDLREQLKEAKENFDKKLEEAQFSASTRDLFGDDSESVGKLQQELNIAKGEKDRLLGRHQKQIREIDDLKKTLREREARIEELNRTADKSAEARSRDQQEAVRRLKESQQQVHETETRLNLVENQRQIDLELLEKRATEAETALAGLKEINQAMQQNLTERDEIIRSLEQRMEALGNRPPAIRAVPSPSTGQNPQLNTDNPGGLRELKGIGEATEKRLNELGISNLSQIAKLKEEDISRICQQFPIFRSQASRYKWIETAKQLTESSATA